jgi:hypothetical protein
VGAILVFEFSAFADELVVFAIIAPPPFVNDCSSITDDTADPQGDGDTNRTRPPLRDGTGIQVPLGKLVHPDSGKDDRTMPAAIESAEGVGFLAANKVRHHGPPIASGHTDGRCAKDGGTYTATITEMPASRAEELPMRSSEEGRGGSMLFSPLPSG